MSYSHILFDVSESGIATVTVNRPQKLNALNKETVGELDDAFRSAETEPGIRGLIVTGAGEKSFVAGADIRELAVASPIEMQEISRRGQSALRRLESMPKPSVAAINGFALGGGLELAMACTLRVAATTAKLGQPEVKLGLIAGYGGTQRLPRLVGRAAALEMLLTGEPVSAAEAHRLGLVNQVVEPAELLSCANQLLARILANGPVAIALTIQAVDTGLSSSLAEGLQFEAAAFGLAAATNDRKEGTGAFLEKRPPAFTGK